MNFKDELEQKITEIEDMLARFLPAERGYQKTVLEAANYSVKAGGKRLRPMLMQETYRLFGGEKEWIEPFMAALEMIHTYSLVHDDLPAMDNDEYRRGQKTTHIVYGEGMAVLAGDALLNYAYETALKAFSCCPDVLPSDMTRLVRALGILAEKAGVYGMIGGQTADIEAEEEKTEVTRDLLVFIHEHKTAALIECAMMIGALLAGAKEEDIIKSERIARNIGVAFQIKDDILDVTGSEEVLGKPLGSDQKNNKLTYVTLLGLEKSIEQVEKLSEEALQLLDSLPGKNEFLMELVKQLITREK